MGATGVKGLVAQGMESARAVSRELPGASSDSVVNPSAVLTVMAAGAPTILAWLYAIGHAVRSPDRRLRNRPEDLLIERGRLPEEGVQFQSLAGR